METAGSQSSGEAPNSQSSWQAPTPETSCEADRSQPPVEAPTTQVPREAPTIHGSGKTSSLCSTSVIACIGMSMKMLKVIAYPKVGVHFNSKDFTATKL